MACQLCLLAVVDVNKAFIQLITCVLRVMLDLDVQPIGLVTWHAWTFPT